MYQRYKINPVDGDIASGIVAFREDNNQHSAHNYARYQDDVSLQEDFIGVIIRGYGKGCILPLKYQMCYKC